MTTSTLIKRTNTTTTKETKSKEALINRLIGKNFNEQNHKSICVGELEEPICVGSIG